MPQAIAIADIPELLAPGMRVYAPGCGGESPAVTAALAARPERAAGVTFAGVYIPGVNRFDYAALHPQARVETVFMTPALRGSYDAGRVDHYPLSYPQADRWLAGGTFDLALLHLAPPDGKGRCSLSIAGDFTPAAWPRAGRIAAHINPNLPALADAPSVPYEAIDYAAEAPGPLLSAPAAGIDAAGAAIAGHVAGLVDDGACLQLGLGSVQAAVLHALAAAGRTGLRIHSGMIADPVVDLAEAGVLLDAPGAVTTGVLLGTDRLYRWAAAADNLCIRPVNETHAHATLAGIDGLVAVNSALEVDLFGQINAETLGGRQVSAVGGLVDFLRGAAESKGGLPVVALKSVAGADRRSRIRARLSGPLVSGARADAGLVVTEHGVADLRGLSVHARAQALIAIADPAHRDSLLRAWREIGNRL